MNKNFDYKKLSPFKWFVLENFPFIEADFDAITDWQLFCKLGEEINKVIEKVNLCGEQVEELTNAFNNLQDCVNNYFVNLDVQDEINEKLNEMAQSGELAEIINQDLLASINSQIANLQTQQGQMATNISNITTDLNNNINKTNNNESQINNLRDTKAENSELIDFINNTNTAIYNQYEMIGRLQGGTPVVVSDVSEMTDTSKIYLLTTNGEWYYYNGSTFVSGGTYQATEFSRNSIESKSIKNIDYSKVEKVESINIGDFGTPQGYGGAVINNYTDNSISFSGSGNHGAFFLNFKDVDKTKNYIITADITTSFECYVSLWEGTSVYKDQLQIINTHFTNKKIACRVTSSKLQNISVPKILVYGSGNSDVTINNIKVYVEKENNFESNLIETIENIKPYYQNIKNNSMQTNIIQWSRQGFGAGVEKNIYSNSDFELYRDDASTGSRGITSPVLNDTSKKLIIECDVENVSQSELNFAFYIAKSNNSFIPIGTNANLDENNHFKTIVDMPYYAVYSGYSNYYVWLMLAGEGIVKFTNFKFYYSDIAETSIYSENFDDMIKNIDSKISGSSTIKNDVSYIQAPTKKYFVQANDNGNLQLINVIPNKTLFIGNSLLLGNHHGDYAFGMCATNINNDYYYHITQYILNKNANATFEKLSGTTFEGAIAQSTVTDFLNNTLLPKLSNDLQLVIVQLGDNVNTSEKVTMFNTSCLELLQFIRTHAPNTRVVFVGEWYSTSQKQTIIANACKNSGCQFVDISMLNTEENRSSIGTVVSYPDGHTETVSSSGVASHPRKYRISKNCRQNYFGNILKKERFYLSFIELLNYLNYNYQHLSDYAILLHHVDKHYLLYPYILLELRHILFLRYHQFQHNSNIVYL